MVVMKIFQGFELCIEKLLSKILRSQFKIIYFVKIGNILHSNTVKVKDDKLSEENEVFFVLHCLLMCWLKLFMTLT